MDKHLGNARFGLGLGLAPGLLLGLMLGFAASSYWTVNPTLAAPGRGETFAPAEAVRHIAQVQADVQALRRSAKDILMRTDSPARVPEARAAWEARYALQLTRLESFESQAVRQKDKDLARAMRLELQGQHEGLMKMLRRIEDGTMPPASKAGRTTAVPAEGRHA
jgi:hypothetical protein